MKVRWHPGNTVRLLENGEQYFPRVFETIDNARHEIIIETFILFEDKVGIALRDRLVAAARRGVRVELTVDGYGSPTFSDRYLESLRAAGVCMRIFDRCPRIWGFRTRLFRRLHRKIIVIDGRIAFVGGINFSADHLEDFGDQAKQDYSIELIGPAVGDIRSAARKLIDDHEPARDVDGSWPPPSPERRPAQGDTRVALVTRDNSEHTGDIEWHYRVAIRAARKRIVIANAYFLPGYRLLKALRDAARRGVDVRLILQGHPDMPLVTAATRSLYGYLLPEGVTILEYCRRPLHGKVAVVDDQWATVGSSNLDPLSLWLNLEANVLVQDRDFNALLHERLEKLAANHCARIESDGPIAGGRLRPLLGVILFHLLRHFPRVAGWLPAHAQTISQITSTPAGDVSTTQTAGIQSPSPVERDFMPERNPVEPVVRKPRTGRSSRLGPARWRLLLKTLTVGFYAALGWVLFTMATRLDWEAIMSAMTEMPVRTAMIAGCLSTATYALYTAFELLASRQVTVPLRRRQIAAIGFISYALNLNVGAILGALAARLRLYSARGVDAGRAVRIIAFNLLTNWTGYVATLGLSLLLMWSDPPAEWRVAAPALRLCGAGLIAALGTYLWACAHAKRRVWTVRGHQLELPRLSTALQQLALSIPLWLASAGSLHVLIGEPVYDLVLITLLTSAVAGLIVRVPAGLGVLEVVFLALLGSTIGDARLIAALLAYRVIHYLGPLLAGAMAFAAMELRTWSGNHVRPHQRGPGSGEQHRDPLQNNTLAPATPRRQTTA